MTRFDYRCSSCGHTREIIGKIGDRPSNIECSCGTTMHPYFGSLTGDNVLVNYGFRPDRYGNKTDRDIAQFQFEHL